MKKRLFFTLSLLATAVIANAQVARWLIPPVYDKLEIPQGTNIILTEQAGSHTLWGKDGRELAKITDIMHSYHDGYAVTTRQGGAFVTAIYDANGQSKPVSNYQLGWGYPLFHDGQLLVHDGHYFHFMDSNGQVDATSYVKAYPFTCGYASCFSYQNLRKMKQPFYILIDKSLKRVPLMLDGRQVDDDDVEFISSACEEGLAVVVIKRKLYFFDTATKELKPLTPLQEADNNTQAKLERDVNECMSMVADTAQVLKAKCGKAAMEITFNNLLRPTAITFNGSTQTFAPKATQRQQFNTSLKKLANDKGDIAIYWGEREMLPPQFSKVPLLFDDKAVVCIDGKYGLLRIYPDDNFHIRLNKGEAIAFRHKRFQSTIRLDMPWYVSPKTTRIEMDEDSGCRIDKISAETKETNDGNYLQYDCELTIPQNITEEKTDIVYPAHIVYEGLRAAATSVKAQGWHNKYYNVDVKENDYSIANGTLSFTFNVSAERLPGEAVYPHEARLLTDTLTSEITERVSETRYKCKVYNLAEGMNTVVVQIIEDGCPPANYTFEVEYIKPKERTGRAKVTMKKRTRHLDI